MLLAMEKFKKKQRKQQQRFKLLLDKVSRKKKYTEAYRAAILLQSAVKIHQAKQEFKAMHDAAAPIQAQAKSCC